MPYSETDIRMPMTRRLVAGVGSAVATTGGRRSWWLLAAGAAFLCFPAIGVASEEVGYLGDLSTVRLLAVSVFGAAVFATLALLPVLTLRLVKRST
ncbi:hypothetical protein ACWFRB_18170 [Rhodococcus sp. NPDC055112]